MSLKRGLAVLGLGLLMFLPVLGQEVTERSRLGAVIEGVTYISSGPLAGRVAFLDCWGIYTCDLIGGGYEKLCSVENILDFVGWPRGIGYIGQGEFEGNFLLGRGGGNELFLVSSSGSLISRVEIEGFQLGYHEGLTEISSGLYAGCMAILGHANVVGGVIRHIYIFRLENQGDGGVRAILVNDLSEVFTPAIYSFSIAFLPWDSPEYPNHFVLGDGEGAMRVYDEQGILQATYSGIPFMEGMTYLRGGIHQGRLFITDMAVTGPAVRNLDGSQSMPIEISVGVPGFGASTLTWLKNSQQLVGFLFTGLNWQWPMYVLSRPFPGQWNQEDVFPYLHLRIPYNISDMTSAGMHYAFGTVDSVPGQSPYEIQVLDADFQLINKISLPIEYSAQRFRRLVHVPGIAGSEDRFLLILTTPSDRILSFDSNFSYPAQVIDLSGKVNSLYRLCYDPAIMRYYGLDDGGLTLRVFDRNWSPLTTYDLSGFIVRGFSDLTKFTSGDLEGNVGLLGGLDRGDNEVVSVNFEYQIGSDLLNKLGQDVLGSGIKDGLASALNRELNNAVLLVNQKKIIPAVSLVQSFQALVQAQRGKGIPAGVADQWLALAAEIIRGLENI